MSHAASTVERLPVDDGRLTELFRTSPPPLFASPDWLAVLADGFGTQAAYYGLIDGGRVVTALPGVTLKLKLLKMFYAGMPYGGVVGRPERMPELIAKLDGALRADGIDVLRIVRTHFDAFAPLEGFRVRRANQHLLDLRPLAEDAGGGLPSSIRRNVKKAQSLGVEIAALSSRGEIDEVFDMYRGAMRHKRSAVFWPKPFLYALFERLGPSGRARAMLARHEGRALAAMIVLNDGPVTYYFLGASRVESLPMRPNDLLFQTVIQECVDASQATFDFMTSGAGDDGLARFKEKWGARREEFEIYEKCVSLKGRLFWKGVWWIGNSRIGPKIGRLIGLWG